ncbi:hypothetical protein Golax_011924 [Gossypium laxum]|uniref:Uncharacterized protein n=1 Tax=Gossypium laxum TaxID=34288 RepID=A0A7J8ZM49_9ROSI|nr:hypothetical protein [Gossypium laxum]
MKIYRVCTTLASLVSQPLLEGRKCLLSNILRELLFIERIRGYTSETTFMKKSG